MTEVELKQRTKQFALRVMKLVGALPENSVGRPMGNQLIRSGTAIMVASRKSSIENQKSKIKNA